MVEFDPVVLKSSNKCEKFTDGWTNGRIYDGEHAQKSSLEVLVQVSLSDHMPCTSTVAEFLYIFFSKDE